uniref:Uncharacterized protein n=1 Tax=Magallana gigas TaxID=29159 RepID=A0A8W8MCE3_MAGGI
MLYHCYEYSGIQVRSAIYVLHHKKVRVFLFHKLGFLVKKKYTLFRTMVTYGSFLAFVFFLGIITENGALCKPDKKEVPMAQAHIQAQEIPEALIAKRGQFRSLFKKDPWVIDWRRIFK